jgi:dihydrolipoamide dehydrogenase
VIGIKKNNMQYDKKYDVVIVGAGPGGLRCAEVLGKAGKNVLLVEKKKLLDLRYVLEV